MRRQGPRPPAQGVSGVAGQAGWRVLAGPEATRGARLREEGGPAAGCVAHGLIREGVEAGLGAGRRMLLHRDLARVRVAVSEEPPCEVTDHHAQTEEHARAAQGRERGGRAAAGVASAAARGHDAGTQERV